MIGPWIPFISVFFKAVKETFNEWRRKRRWNADLQIYYLRIQVQEDARWLAHDPIASALCDRYLSMLADDWEKRSRLSISDFRRSIGRDPHQNRGDKNGN